MGRSRHASRAHGRHFTASTGTARPGGSTTAHLFLNVSVRLYVGCALVRPDVGRAPRQEGAGTRGLDLMRSSISASWAKFDRRHLRVGQLGLRQRSIDEAPQASLARRGRRSRRVSAHLPTARQHRASEPRRRCSRTGATRRPPRERRLEPRGRPSRTISSSTCSCCSVIRRSRPSTPAPASAAPPSAEPLLRRRCSAAGRPPKPPRSWQPVERWAVATRARATRLDTITRHAVCAPRVWAP